MLFREWEKELMKLKEGFVLAADGEKKAKKTPSLLRAIMRVVWIPCAVDGILCFVQLIILNTLQPIFQRLVTNYFSVKNEISRNEALIYAGGLVLVTLGIVFLMHHFVLRSQQVGMRIRVACCSLIYRKVNKL